MGRLRNIALDVTPLRDSRDFRLLWAGVGITAAGSQLTRVAAAFQVYELTGSTLVVGLLGLVTMFPLFFGSILGGAVADHFERRTRHRARPARRPRVPRSSWRSTRRRRTRRPG